MLIGKPPLEVELEIEMKCREVEELPEGIAKAYCFALVKTKCKIYLLWQKQCNVLLKNLNY